MKTAENDAGSRAASAQYGVCCPTCGAGHNEPCRARTTRRVTDTHVARIETAYRVNPPENKE